MDISRPVVEKPRFIHVEKFVESRTNSIAQLLKAIDNDALVSGEVTKGPRTAAQRLPRHMRRRAMAYDVRRFPKTMREYARSHLISKHAKKCPSRFARRKNVNSRDKFGRSTSTKGKWLSTHVWHAKRFRMTSKWGFKIADRSFQRGFRAVLRDSNKYCVIRDRSYYSCVTIKSPDALKKVLEFSQTTCRGQSSRGEEEECHQLYVPGQFPLGYIGPARFQRLTGERNDKVYVWMHPSAKETFMNTFSEKFGLKREEGNEETEQPSRYVNGNLEVTVDTENISRFHLSGPKCLTKLRDSVRLVKETKFQSEHDRFLSVADSVFSSTRDGEVLYLLIEDPRTAWDRKTVLSNNRKGEEAKDVDGDWREQNEPVNEFWSREFREQAIAKRVSDGEFQKQNAQRIGGLVSTEAKVPIVVIIRNGGFKALDGIDLIIPEPFSKDLWVALQRRGVRASGLRDEISAHLESQTFCYPIDDVESQAGKESEEAMKHELTRTYLAKPHNRRCKFWSALSVKYPFEFRWNELAKGWNSRAEKAFVCRDLLKLREIKQGLKRAEGLDQIVKANEGMLVPVRLAFVGRGRPKRFGMICLPTTDDLISIRRNRNLEIIQTPRTSSEIEEPMEVDEEIPRKELEGYVSLDAAATEKPISLKWLFEESTKLDDKTLKRKRANRRKKESKKRQKLEFGKRREEAEEEETQRSQTEYRLSANREIIGRVVAGEQSVLGGRGLAIGYICADVLPIIASNYHKTKTIVMVRNNTSKYYHPAYLTVLTSAIQI
ncbi:unnamed protein product [Caenorhabditis sp. 36 PRJEB53466]|nr:unnamed protein product [Caenorhabditis sp. 36 PRJEB53466]